MSSTKLAHAVARYIAAANSQDIDAVTACFNDDALVHDEKQDRQGIAAIRRWAEEVSEKYRPAIEVVNVEQMGGTTVLAGRVSGLFPGSPVELRYVFTLDGGKIRRLEIG